MDFNFKNGIYLLLILQCLYQICMTASPSSSVSYPQYKFGCTFEDENYNVIENNRRPLFGNPVAPAFFTNESALQDIENSITNIVADVISKNLLNQIDDIADFFEEFKKEWNRKKIRDVIKFIEFYKSFKPSFYEDSANIGLLVKVLNTFIDTHENFAGNVYIATGCSYSTLDDINTLVSADEIHPNFQHTLIIGVFKFVLNNELGYILMDPEHGLSPAVRIMANSNMKIRDTQEVVSIQMFSSNRNYILAEHSAEGVLNNRIYFVTSPYCSIMRQAKAALLRSLRVLMQRNSAGVLMAVMYYNLAPIGEPALVTTKIYDVNDPFGKSINQMRAGLECFNYKRVSNVGYRFIRDSLQCDKLHTDESYVYERLRVSHFMFEADRFRSYYQSLVLNLTGSVPPPSSTFINFIFP